MNAAFVTAAVPEKVVNFLIRRRNIDAVAFQRWTSAHPDWVADLKRAARQPDRFPQIVEALADAIRPEDEHRSRG